METEIESSFGVLVKASANVDNVKILIDFERDRCSAEPPMYTKMRSTKMDEIATIQLMINILRDLNWSGAVYNAIARISVDGVDYVLLL